MEDHRLLAAHPHEEERPEVADSITNQYTKFSRRGFAEGLIRFGNTNTQVEAEQEGINTGEDDQIGKKRFIAYTRIRRFHLRNLYTS